MSLRLKTILGIAIIEILLLMILIISGLNMLKESNEKQLIQHANTTVRLFANATKDAILSTDLATLESFVTETLKNKDIKYVRIKNDRHILAEGGEEKYLIRPHQQDYELANVTDGIFDVNSKIVEGGVLSGIIEIGLSTNAIERAVTEAKHWTLGIASIEVILVALFSFVLGSYLTNQLKRLKNASDLISKTGPGHQINITGNDEITSVIRAFNKMSAKLKQNYDELEVSITKQKEVIDVANRNHAINQAMLSSSLDALITIDDNGKVLDFNNAAEETFGWTEGEIYGQYLANYIIPHKHREAHARGLSNYLETGKSTIMNKRMQLTALHKNGRSFPIEIVISPIKTTQGAIFTAFIRDISDRLATEKKLQLAAQAKGNFLATMSHEIRTPMNAILGILGLLRDTSLNNKQRELVRTGRESGELLLTIINDILDFSRMEADKLEIENNDFDLYLLLSKTIKLLKHQADKKNLSLILNIGAGLPPYTKGDADRLQQILINLINNAIKFTSSGSIIVSATALYTESNTFTLCCSIEDSGIGIDNELQNTLFEEFTMVDQTHSRKHEGTGLGLAICKRLTHLMHGEISVQSEPGHGSTFTFTVKLEAIQKLKHDTDHASAQKYLIPEANTRILLAEDNSANQMVIKNILEYAGLQVDIVANGQEAVNAVCTLPYDIVLMDVSMPEMDGMTATRKIRCLKEPLSSIPIVALTAHALTGDREHFLESGMNDYLSKPIDREAALDCIARWTKSELKQLESTTEVNSSAADIAIDTAIEIDTDYVDESVLQQLVQDTDAKVVPEFLRFYIEDAQNRIKLIEDAASTSDFKTLEFETHTIGSSAAAHGNPKLYELARKTENYCINKNYKQALLSATELTKVADRSFELLAIRASREF